MGSSFLEEIDRLQKGVTDVAVASVEECFKYRPGVESMLRWLEVRAERELGAAQMISMAVVKYEEDIDKKFLVNLAKFIWDETRHYRDLSRFIEGLREAMPPEESPLVQPPEPENGWWETIWRNVEREKFAPLRRVLYLGGLGPRHHETPRGGVPKIWIRRAGGHLYPLRAR